MYGNYESDFRAMTSYTTFDAQLKSNNKLMFVSRSFKVNVLQPSPRHHVCVGSEDITISQREDDDDLGFSMNKFHKRITEINMKLPNFHCLLISTIASLHLNT